MWDVLSCADGPKHQDVAPGNEARLQPVSTTDPLTPGGPNGGSSHLRGQSGEPLRRRKRGGTQAGPRSPTPTPWVRLSVPPGKPWACAPFRSPRPHGVRVAAAPSPRRRPPGASCSRHGGGGGARAPGARVRSPAPSVPAMIVRRTRAREGAREGASGRAGVARSAPRSLDRPPALPPTPFPHPGALASPGSSPTPRPRPAPADARAAAAAAAVDAALFYHRDLRRRRPRLEIRVRTVVATVIAADEGARAPGSTVRSMVSVPPHPLFPTGRDYAGGCLGPRSGFPRGPALSPTDLVITPPRLRRPL